MSRRNEKRTFIENTSKSSNPTDIFIELENSIIVIEYDGEYWHRFNQNTDEIKTNLMLESGILVVRVCESTPTRTAEKLRIEHPNLIQLDYWFNRTNRNELSRIAFEISRLLGDRLVH